MSAAETQKTVVVDGRKLVYRDWGRPDARALVCVHGFTQSGDGYERLAAALPNRRLLAPTLRGHGDSEWSHHGDYQVADYVQDLEGFVEAWGLSDLDLLGTSLGGYAAIAFAAEHPEIVRRLVVHDISPEEVPAAVDAMAATVDSIPESYETIDEFISLRRARFWGHLPVEEQQARAARQLRETADGRWAEKHDPALLRHRVSTFDPPDLWGEFASLECPVLVIWGGKSNWLSEENAERMVAEGRDVGLVSVPDEGHVPDLLGPEVLPTLQSFLGEPLSR